MKAMEMMGMTVPAIAVAVAKITPTICQVLHCRRLLRLALYRVRLPDLDRGPDRGQHHLPLRHRKPAILVHSASR